MMTTGKKFVLLLQSGMGIPVKGMPVIDGEKEWLVVMGLAKKQAVQGILERGIRKLPEDQRPPRKLFLRSYMQSEKIATLNRKIDEEAVKLADFLKEEGFTCCILKGQGNGQMYPDSTARVPGDIDVWVAAPAEQVIAFARKAKPNAKAGYHHVDYAKRDGVEVELHYRPAFLNNPIYNRRLQKWFLSERASQCEHRVALASGLGEICVPTDSFNRIFQMAHIMNHIIHEGIGMRQLMDYYFLLKRGFTQEERLRDEQLLRRFGLYDIAAAVMYVLHWLFGLPEEQMIVGPDKKRGVLLLKEVLHGGNFGHYDPQVQRTHTQMGQNVLRLKRDWKLLTAFPGECLSEPLFRWWHFFWRLRHRG